MTRPKIIIDILTITYFLCLVGVTVSCGNPMTLVLFLMALALHEAGHLLFAELLGFQVYKLRLTPLGACLIIDPLMEINPDAEFIIAAAGPFSNFLMVAGVLYLEFFDIKGSYLNCWRQWNWLLGVVNLIPAIPLDGGRILHACLKRFFGAEVSHETIIRIALFIGGLILSIGVRKFYIRQSGILYILMGAFIIYQAFSYHGPKLESFWRMSEQRKRMLRKKGFAALKPVLVRPETLVRNILQRYGGNEFLLLVIRDSNATRLITEEEAWEMLMDKGYNITFANF